MTIPKWILHPTLLLTAGGALMYFFWLSPPTVQTVHTAVANTPIIPAPLPARSDLVEIISFNDQGKLRVEKHDAELIINDKRFQKLNPDQWKISQQFFVGKLIAKKRINDQARLDLPIELYETSCFTTATHDQNRPGCPILLQP